MTTNKKPIEGIILAKDRGEVKVEKFEEALRVIKARIRKELKLNNLIGKYSDHITGFPYARLSAQEPIFQNL